MALRVTLNNRFAILHNWWAVEPDIDGYFMFQMENHRFTPAGRNGWDGLISLIDGERVGTGLFVHKLPAILAAGVEVQIRDQRTFPQFWRAEDSQLKIELRDFQRAAVEFMIANSNGGGVLIAPTATGKTAIAAAFFHRLVGTGIFLVDDRALGRQTQQELSKILGEPVGFIGDGVYSTERITVVLVQSAMAHSDVPEFVNPIRNRNAMVIDELHTMCNSRTWAAVTRYNPQCCFGATATIDMDAPIGLRARALCGEAVYRYSYQDAVENAHLTQGWAYRVHVPDAAEFYQDPYTQEYESYSAYYTRNVVRNEWLNNLGAHLAAAMVEQGHTTVILTRMLEHQDVLSLLLHDMQVPHSRYSGRQSSQTRMEVRAALDTGLEKLVLATTGTMTKGISIPGLSCLLDLSQSKKPEHSIQRAGRGARVKDGKDYFLFFDFGVSGKAVRGVRKTHLLAQHQAGRMRALKNTGYHTQTIQVDNTLSARDECERIVSTVLTSG